jgi:NADH:ubiquinone oxidoreductase subunit E
MVLTGTGALLATGAGAGAAAFCAKARAVKEATTVALRAIITLQATTVRRVPRGKARTGVCFVFMCSLQGDQRAQTQKPMAKYATVQATNRLTDHWPMRVTAGLGV